MLDSIRECFNNNFNKESMMVEYFKIMWKRKMVIMVCGSVLVYKLYTMFTPDQPWYQLW